MRLLLLFITGVMMTVSVESQNRKLLIGTYTTNSKSEGIYVFDFDTRTGKSAPLSHIAAEDPSFLTLSPDNKFVYAVNESGADKGGGTVSAFSFDSSKGQLQYINKQSTHGNHPCYVTIDKSGKTVFAGNYSSGNFTTHAIEADGSISAANTIVQHTGSGPNKDRQGSPHVHCTLLSPDNRWLFVTDLGTDKITTYPFDASSGKLYTQPVAETASPAGAGPRHLTFNSSGTRLYLIEELTGGIIVYQHKKGHLSTLQTIHSLPEAQRSPANSADIHLSPDGKFLYATHRINNTIAIFSVHAKTGKLTHLETVPTLGANPRNFTIDPNGNFLLVAHQNSDNIVVFKRNKKTGKLTDSGERIITGKPVCLVWSK